MLRRGDKREKEMLDANHIDNENSAKALQEMTRKYIDSLETIAILRAEIRKLEANK